MKIVVLVKQVPDTWGARRLDPDTGRVDRAASDRVVDDLTERAVEVALAVKDRDRDTEVVVLTMGPSPAADMLKKLLALGVDSAVHVRDDRLTGADHVATARALAAALDRIGFDLVLGGVQTTDGGGGVVPAMVAELLAMPLLGPLASLAIDPVTREVTGERVTEWEVAELVAALPAVATVTERMPEARFASFKGIMGAKRKPTIALDLDELGLGPAADAVTDAASRTRVVAVAERPPRSGGRRVIDRGGGADELVAFLTERRLL